ncbi:hypothetical protein ACKVMT_01330 [Halobacteriales archaeon Cl-PHB]
MTPPDSHDTDDDASPTDGRLSADPHDRMGVYKRLADVPARHRLDRYADDYAGRDVWGEYARTYIPETYPDASADFHATLTNAGSRWQAHMADRGRHHALARPTDVAAWCDALLERVTVETAYGQYWVRLEEFYGWLQTHADHPHRYHPALMAVPTSDAARQIWHAKLTGGNRTGGGWDG